MKTGLQQLISAYPGKFSQVLPNYIQWEDGTLMPYQIDVGPKDPKTLAECPDLEDQMAIPYTAGRDYLIPIPKNHEPGHIRYYPFFQKMYGATEDEVTSHLVPITWLPTTEGRTLWITSINDVHLKLQAVSNELDLLSPEIKKYVINCSGTFNWRKINGSKRVSPHGFGIAIDINASLANYWQWDTLISDPYQEIDLKYKNSIPLEIVEIFEKHGFIWGGKWYQYDTMHFEYRPELLPAANQ